jgi:hypothetical protein
VWLPVAVAADALTEVVTNVATEDRAIIETSAAAANRVDAPLVIRVRTGFLLLAAANASQDVDELFFHRSSVCHQNMT